MTSCWLHGPLEITWCSTKCRAWSKTDKECEFILAARTLKRLGKAMRYPGPPEVQT